MMMMMMVLFSFFSSPHFHTDKRQNVKFHRQSSMKALHAHSGNDSKLIDWFVIIREGIYLIKWHYGKTVNVVVEDMSQVPIHNVIVCVFQTISWKPLNAADADDDAGKATALLLYWGGILLEINKWTSGFSNWWGDYTHFNVECLINSKSNEHRFIPYPPAR